MRPFGGAWPSGWGEATSKALEERIFISGITRLSELGG